MDRKKLIELVEMNKDKGRVGNNALDLNGNEIKTTFYLGESNFVKKIDDGYKLIDYLPFGEDRPSEIFMSKHQVAALFVAILYKN